MKSKIVTICLLVVYLLLPFLILYLCSLQMAIGYDAQFSTLYPQYIGVIIYLLPLLNGVLYGVLLFLCMKKGREGCWQSLRCLGFLDAVGDEYGGVPGL